ncbi:MAG: TonB family protein [Bacteroidales bacterium]|nr:TonB family protein [Bacteroidales bacterium]
MRKITIILSLLICSTALYSQSFSIEKQLKQHVEYLSSETLQGRKAGSEGEKAAALYLYSQMKQAGVTMLTDESGQDFSIVRDGDTVKSLNIIGIVEGYDPALRNEYIVIGAHFDHIGVTTLTVDGKSQKQIFPGADNNASGVASLVEIARMVASNNFMFRRSIIFVGFGAGESSMAGSWYFVNRAFEKIDKVKLMINLDMLGRGNKENPFQLLSLSSRNDILDIMDETKNEPIVIQPVLADANIFPSDHLPFYEKNIPTVLFSTGMTREYNTVHDLPKFILYNNMENNCYYIYSFLKTVAGRETIFPSLTPQATANVENVYSPADCDKRPQFFHSNEQHFLEKWVYTYVKYPKAAITNGIQGKVVIEFIVEKDGSVTNVQVVKGVDELIDNEAVKVVSISPKWIPGEINGRKVRTKISIPVEFRLK